MRCLRCCAQSVAGRCTSSRSSPTALTSGKYWTTSGWSPSHHTSPRHAGRRCGIAPMCKPVRALSQPQTEMKSAKLHRTLRLIGASVGKDANSGLANAARQAAFVTTQNESYRQISANWLRATTQADLSAQACQACDALNLYNTCAQAVGVPICFSIQQKSLYFSICCVC